MRALEVDTRGLAPLSVLKNPHKRIAFAMANALNATIRDVQRREVEQTRRQFTVRAATKQFVERNAAVIRGQGGGSGFASATQSRFSARIQVGERPRFLLGGFEHGDPRQPVKGKAAAVPVGAARPSRESSVPDALTFRRLRFRKSAGDLKARRDGRKKYEVTMRAKATRTKSGKVQWKGEARTFILKSTRTLPGGGVFQRIGPGRGDIRILYAFKGGQRLDHRLRYGATGTAEAVVKFPRYVKREVEASFRFAASRAFK